MEKVRLIDEDVEAELIQRGAYVSLVRYQYAGMDWEVYVENEEYEFVTE